MPDVVVHRSPSTLSGAGKSSPKNGRGDAAHSDHSKSQTIGDDGKSTFANVAASLSATNTDGEHREILIVDDDVHTARALQLLMKQSGYVARVCHNGTDALAHAATNAPAAALIDVHLGDLSGLVLAKELRELVGERMPIIMLSGDTSMETLNSLSHVGATYFFSKPVNPTTLIEHLREWVP